MPLDPETVATLLSLPSSKGTTLMHDLAGIFMADLPGRTRLMQEAMDRQDGHALGRVAHLLKGSCSAIGAMPLSDACGALEQAGQAGRWTEVGQLWAQFEAQVALTREDLKSYLPDPPQD